MRATIMILVCIAAFAASTARADWTQHTLDSDFDGANNVYATDVDGDGDVDVIGSSYFDWEVMWWENVNGDGSQWIEHMVDNWYSAPDGNLHAADVDGDGDTDLLACHVSSIDWWENVDGDGLNWTLHTIENQFPNAQYVYATDMDDDGDVDVLGAGAAISEIRWWENVDGTGLNWVGHLVTGEFSDVNCVIGIDMDNDGDTDVLGSATDVGDGGISWWENIDGTGLNWAEHPVVDEYTPAVRVYAADVDGDDDLDVLSATELYSNITWWENVDGTGLSWSMNAIDDRFRGANSVYALDIDSDDDVDVLGTASAADDICWWENVDGTGLNMTKHTLDGDFFGANCVFATDLDDDGDIDVLGTAADADDICWWEQPDSYMLEIVPWAEPVYVFPDGGVFQYTFTFSNATLVPFQTDVWMEVILPNGFVYPLFQIGVTFPADETVNVMLEQEIPAFAPAGTYQYVSNVGQYPDDIYLTDSFEFTKLNYGIAATTIDAWSLSGWTDELTQINDTNAFASTYTLEQISPNPFNSTTTISFSLPETADLTVQVYNMTGQLVATLVDGNMSAGFHRLTFDASELSSGLYFVRATVPGHLDQVQKVMLVR